MKKMKVSITTEHVFSIEEINDLIVGALEGGINYWCGSARIKKMPDKSFFGVAIEDQDKVELASDVVGYGGTLILRDVEDPTEKWELNIEKMLNGIKMHCTNTNRSPKELIDDYDVDDCDCIIQYALFGELVYG